MSRAKAKIPTKHARSKLTKVVVAVIFVIALIVKLYDGFVDYEKAYNAIARADGLFSVHYIDVGQGDATLVRSPDGEFMLIDCGPTSESEYLVKYLKSCGVDSLEYLLITHPHEDHYGGASEVIASFPVESFIIHEDFADEYPYDRFIYMLENNGFGVDTEIVLTSLGETYEFADCADFEIISPAETDDDLNEASLAFNLKFGKTSFMFTGDAEKGSERKMLSGGYDLSASVLQAGHHGSSTSNTANFLEAVSPEYVVVSCGKDNSYGHPHKSAVENFDAVGAEILRTDILGDIVITCDGKSVTYVEDFFNQADESRPTENKTSRFDVFVSYIKSFID